MAVVQRKGPDTLDKTVTYLAKRDGIDKASAGNAWECVGVAMPSTIHFRLTRSSGQLVGTSRLFAQQVLKVIRYSTKLALATALKNDSGDLAVRLKEFESSIGTSRFACDEIWTCRLLAGSHHY